MTILAVLGLIVITIVVSTIAFIILIFLERTKKYDERGVTFIGRIADQIEKGKIDTKELSLPAIYAVSVIFSPIIVMDYLLHVFGLKAPRRDIP